MKLLLFQFHSHFAAPASVWYDQKCMMTNVGKNLSHYLSAVCRLYDSNLNPRLHSLTTKLFFPIMLWWQHKCWLVYLVMEFMKCYICEQQRCRQEDDGVDGVGV